MSTRSSSPMTQSGLHAWMRGKSAVGLLGLSLLALLSSHCFVPTYSDCAFRCGTEEPRCPSGYECRSDNYCHKPESTNLCVFGLDLAGVAIDLGQRPDGS